MKTYSLKAVTAVLLLAPSAATAQCTPSSDYLSGRRFIERLAHSARQPFGDGPVGLAAVGF